MVYAKPESVLKNKTHKILGFWNTDHIIPASPDLVIINCYGTYLTDYNEHFLFLWIPGEYSSRCWVNCSLTLLVSPGPFLRILVAYFCISCSSPFLTDPLFRLFLLSRLVIGLSPIGRFSTCFGALSRYQKTVSSPQHRSGDGRETNRIYVLVTLGLFFFLQSLIIFHLLYMSFHLIEF